MKQLWFKRKKYGRGWIPVSWQGWIVLFVYTGYMVVIVFNTDQNLQSIYEILIQIVVPAVILTSFLLLICYKKGEKSKWQWGNVNKTKD